VKYPRPTPGVSTRASRILRAPRGDHRATPPHPHPTGSTLGTGHQAAKEFHRVLTAPVVSCSSRRRRAGVSGLLMRRPPRNSSWWSGPRAATASRNPAPPDIAGRNTEVFRPICRARCTTSSAQAMTKHPWQTVGAYKAERVAPPSLVREVCWIAYQDSVSLGRRVWDFESLASQLFHPTFDNQRGNPKRPRAKEHVG
jgi:hypothetical protein